MASQPTPPGPRTPPRNSRPYQGLINQWFPLIRPAIKPLFLGGGTLGGGRLTSHDSILQNVEEKGSVTKSITFSEIKSN